MIEKVARAICEARGHNPNVRIEEYGQSTFAYWQWELFRDDAKAAIAAMRAPSEEMLLVGARSIGESMGVANHIERSRPCWRAMIGVALEGATSNTPDAK